MYRIRHIPTGKYYSQTNHKYRMLWFMDNKEYRQKFLFDILSKTGKVWAIESIVNKAFEKLERLFPGQFVIESLVAEKGELKCQLN